MSGGPSSCSCSKPVSARDVQEAGVGGAPFAGDGDDDGWIVVPLPPGDLRWPCPSAGCTGYMEIVNKEGTPILTPRRAKGRDTEANSCETYLWHGTGEPPFIGVLGKVNRKSGKPSVRPLGVLQTYIFANRSVSTIIKIFIIIIEALSPYFREHTRHGYIISVDMHGTGTRH